MAVLAEVVQFVVNAGGGVSLPKMRAHFPSITPVLHTCLERGLLDIRGDCYHATNTSAGFLIESAVEAKRDLKWCPRCKTFKAASEFWCNPQRSDGLYPWCAKCATERKMELKQIEARQAITEAAQLLVGAVAQWDEAVKLLAEAWTEVMRADEILRLNRRASGTDFESGRMEARLLHPRAMFALSIALTDAKYPLPYGYMRECGMSKLLADYVGTDPQNDYFPAPIVEVKPAAKRKRA
jgi:hypothetical protein